MACLTTETEVTHIGPIKKKHKSYGKKKTSWNRIKIIHGQGDAKLGNEARTENRIIFHNGYTWRMPENANTALENIQKFPDRYISYMWYHANKISKWQ